MGLFRRLLDQVNRAFERLDNPNPSNPAPQMPGPCCPSSTGTTGDLSLVCHNPEHISGWHLHELNQYRSMCSGKICSWILPFAGNAFLCSAADNTPVSDSNKITDHGLVNWGNPDITPSLFFHCDKPGPYLIGLRMQVPAGSRATIEVAAMMCSSQTQCQAPQRQQVVVEGLSSGAYQIIPCLQFLVSHEGYVKMCLKGVQKSGSVFANVSHAILIPANGLENDNEESSSGRQKRSLAESSQPQALDKSMVKFVSDPDDFYFGRRGPSVHLQFLIPPARNPETRRQVEYFYNEVFVPNGQDVVGAYFCAIGFSGGYFGIQVNSESERRVLFSVWSAYSTDNPNEIPQDYKVTLMRRGNGDMHIGEFGNEGSGGQSYMRYAWKAETLYKFLVQAKPLDQENTQFSAWFSDSSEPGNKWRLIASFKKPKVSTHLQGLYSFSENFIPSMGHVSRLCLFGNQWAWDSAENGGAWVEVVKVKFTADATLQKRTRVDVAGGVMQSYGWNNDSSTNRFFLKNCGFFSEMVEPDQEFSRSPCGCVPVVDLNNLP